MTDGNLKGTARPVGTGEHRTPLTGLMWHDTHHHQIIVKDGDFWRVATSDEIAAAFAVRDAGIERLRAEHPMDKLLAFCRRNGIGFVLNYDESCDEWELETISAAEAERICVRKKAALVLAVDRMIEAFPTPNLPSTPPPPSSS